jgi:hypothetical protein
MKLRPYLTAFFYPEILRIMDADKFPMPCDCCGVNLTSLDALLSHLRRHRVRFHLNSFECIHAF